MYALFPVFKTTTLLRTNTKPEEQKKKKTKENQDEESNMRNILSTNNGSKLVPALNLQRKVVSNAWDLESKMKVKMALQQLFYVSNTSSITRYDFSIYLSLLYIYELAALYQLPLVFHTSISSGFSTFTQTPIPLSAAAEAHL